MAQTLSLSAGVGSNSTVSCGQFSHAKPTPPYGVPAGAFSRIAARRSRHKFPTQRFFNQLSILETLMIKRRSFSGLLTAIAVASVMPGMVKAQDTPVANNVVLVHGLYADGSSWIDVIPYLQRAGLQVTAVQNPLTSLADDVAATRRVLASQEGPTVLVGHSFAGTIISEVGNDPKVSALVYVAARAPDAGEDFGGLAAKFPKPPASAGVVKANGFFWLSEVSFLRDFAGDLDPARARALYAVQGRGADALPNTKTTTAAWRAKPTWYQVSTEDRTINPELERFLAKRMNATTIELDSSHVSLVSHPKEIADLILLAAGRNKSR
jgi:pimeloyl-ACP methyl ester carboxylesterase